MIYNAALSFIVESALPGDNGTSCEWLFSLGRNWSEKVKPRLNVVPEEGSKGSQVVPGGAK